MPCGPDCACEPGVECLSVVAPERFGFFREWCASGDPVKRLHVRNRSAIGYTPPLPDPGAVPDVSLAPPYRPPPQPGADPTPAAARGPAPAAGPMPVGDLVALLAARIGADRAARWVAKQLGAQDCGCESRRIALNKIDSKVRRFLGRKTSESP